MLYKTNNGLHRLFSPPNLNLEGIFDDLVKNNFPIPLQMDSVIESGKTLKLF